MVEQQDITEVVPEIKAGNCNILFLDISSSCTGFAIANVDFTEKKAKATKAGAIWLDDNWEHARKYNYLANAVTNYFNIVEGIDLIVVEQYSVNKDKMSGVLVSPEAHGAIKSAAFEVGTRVLSILPQSWRSLLSIKGEPTGKGKKKDFKEPTKRKLKELGADLPEKVISNITKNERKAPSDLSDAMAIMVAWLKKYGIETDITSIDYNSHTAMGEL